MECQYCHVENDLRICDKCMATIKENMEKRIANRDCLWCHKKFRGKLGSHFCSQSCSYQYKKNNKEWYEKHKEKVRNYVREFREKRGNTPYKNLKYAVINTLGCKCAICGVVNIDNLVVHHKRYGMDITINDLQILCKDCHHKFHGLARSNNTLDN